MGRRSNTVPLDHLKAILEVHQSCMGVITWCSSQSKSLYAGNFLYLITISLTKASILLFYLRLFGTPGTRPGLRKLLYATQVLVIVWLIASIIPGMYRCHPIDDMWNPLIFSGPDVRNHCIDENAYYVSTSVFNVALDFWILVLPLSIVWKLQLSRRRKAGLIAIFLLGVLYVLWKHLSIAKPICIY